MKPKNIRSAPIFTSILLCSSILTGCADTIESTALSENTTTSIEETSETTTEATTSETTETSETTTYPTEDVPDEVLEQIQIIYDNYDIWKLQTETDTDLSEADGLSSPRYAVTDLDNDGMLEIMKTGFAGSGVYSRNIFYEVTEDGELELLNEEFLGGFGRPGPLESRCLQLLYRRRRHQMVSDSRLLSERRFILAIRVFLPFCRRRIYVRTLLL